MYFILLGLSNWLLFGFLKSQKVYLPRLGVFSVYAQQYITSKIKNQAFFAKKFRKIKNIQPIFWIHGKNMKVSKGTPFETWVLFRLRHLLKGICSYCQPLYHYLLRPPFETIWQNNVKNACNLLFVMLHWLLNSVERRFM